MKKRGERSALRSSVDILYGSPGNYSTTWFVVVSGT
jgi:hypothetical protein